MENIQTDTLNDGTEKLEVRVWPSISAFPAIFFKISESDIIEISCEVKIAQ